MHSEPKSNTDLTKNKLHYFLLLNHEQLRKKLSLYCQISHYIIILKIGRINRSWLKGKSGYRSKICINSIIVFD